MTRPICLLLALLAGCASSPPSQFFTLSAAPAAPRLSPAAQSGYSIVVGPVEVPESVDRPQLVLRVSENRVRILEEARWAEPLRAAIPGVIAGDLAQQLGARRVLAYPQDVESFDYQVLLEVLRFDSVLGEAATVEIAWSVKPANGGERRFGRSLVREPVQGEGYEALVAAHSRALHAIGGEIARAFRTWSEAKS
jgi:uncharacterized lipoprotein YmbA